MEASKLTKLTTCVFVLLNIIMVIDIDAMPGGYRRANTRGGYRRANTVAVGSSHSCPSNAQYACMLHNQQGILCINITQLCDGKRDCPHGEDEGICKFMKPTVTKTSITTQTIKTTLTNTTIVAPVIIVNSTSTCTTSVNCTADSLVASLYAVGALLPIAATVCRFQLVAIPAAPANLPGFSYSSSTPITIIPVTKTLKCTATITYP